MRVWTIASQDTFVGFNPLTITSGQGYISELIAQNSHFSDDRSSPSSQKMNGECPFLKASQCIEGPVLSTPNQYTNVTLDIVILKKDARKKETDRKLQKLKSENVNVSNVTIHSIYPIYFLKMTGRPGQTRPLT